MGWGVMVCLLTATSVLLPLGNTVPAEQNGLVWSTFLGGSSDDRGGAIAVDSAGSVYVTGQTYSVNFPTTTGAYDTTHHGSYDVIAVKLTPEGTALEYATLLGGSGIEGSISLAIDQGGCAYFIGRTESGDFPITPGAFDSSYNGDCDAFVVKLNPQGDDLEYATYLGGAAWEHGLGIALDGSGCAYLTGETESPDFPVTAGAFDRTHNGWRDAYLVRLNPQGSALDYAAFLGGANYDAAWSIVVDSSRCAYVTGLTYSLDFPVTPGAFDTTCNNKDAFVAKLNPQGDSLCYATFLGGSQTEDGYDLAVDGDRNVYVIGSTSSPDFPATPGVYDTSGRGYSDVFVAKINPQGNALDYATYLGGTGNDYGRGIRLDGAGAVYMTGLTQSTDFPVTADAFDTTHNGALGDVFVARLNPGGSWLSYSTFLGGSGEDGLADWGGDIALDQRAHVYLTGFTLSADFPTTAGAVDTTFNGSWDVFVTELFLSAPEKITDLKISLAGEDLSLEWSAVTADTNGHLLEVDYYRIYRDSSAGFDPDGGPFDSTVEPAYIDSSVALGDADSRYYYLVTAVTGGRESEYSPYVGGFQQRLSRVK